MPLIIDEASAEAKSRLALISISALTVRLMENWRRGIFEMTGHMPDYDATMIMVSVAVVAGDRLTRMRMAPGLHNLANELPADSLGRCNLSSISAATGLNRETVRRKVGRLEAAGLLTREDSGNIYLSRQVIKQLLARQVIRALIDAVRQTAVRLSRDNVLVEQP